MSTDDRTDAISGADLDPDTTTTDTTTETIMDTDRATHPGASLTPATTSGTSATAPLSDAVHADPAGHADPSVPERGVRVGTVVWGLVIAAVGIGLIAYASGLRFDVELAVIILIATAGLALLAGSVLSNRRRHR